MGSNIIHPIFVFPFPSPSPIKESTIAKLPGVEFSNCLIPAVFKKFLILEHFGF
jgi:hypothetical protein